MAVKREKLSRAVGSAQASEASLASGSQPGSEPAGGDKDDLRIRQLRARDMLRGDLEGEELDKYV